MFEGPEFLSKLVVYRTTQNEMPVSHIRRAAVGPIWSIGSGSLSETLRRHSQLPSQRPNTFGTDSTMDVATLFIGAHFWPRDR